MTAMPLDDAQAWRHGCRQIAESVAIFEKALVEECSPETALALTVRFGELLLESTMRSNPLDDMAPLLEKMFGRPEDDE